MVFMFTASAQHFNSPVSSIRAKKVDFNQNEAFISSIDSAASYRVGVSLNSPPVAEPIYSLPLRYLKLTSSFGYRVHPVTGRKDFHRGVDLSARSEPVFAITAGKVSKTGYNPILGNYMRIRNGELECIYGHLSFILVKTGAEISCGQVIGITGATGRATGEHLHLSIKFQGSYIHPLQFLKGMSLKR